MLLPAIGILRQVFSPLRFQFSQFCDKITMPSALVILSEGAEEMETVITVDVLRRGGVNHVEY